MSTRWHVVLFVAVFAVWVGIRVLVWEWLKRK